MLFRVKKYFLIGFLFFLGMIPRADAEEGYTDYSYVLRLHFTDIAYWQKVDRVVAHVGVQAHEVGLNEGDYRTYWKDPKNIELQFRSNHFESLILLRAKELVSDPRIDYPVVQYEIWFADGSKQSTEIYQVPVISETSYLNLSGKDEQAIRSAFYERYFYHAGPVSETEAILLKFSR